MHTWGVIPLSPVRTYTHFGWASFIPAIAFEYLMDGRPLNQKKIRTFEYRVHWNINIQKKEKKNPYKNENGSVGWSKNSGEQY